jgi:hypothetical protein
MLLAEDYDMIKALPSDRTDEPFRVAVLPWRLCRDRPISYAHCPEPPDEGFPVGAVSIANDISRRFLPAAGFGHLASDPFGVWIGGDSRQRSSRRECCGIRRPYNSRNEIVGTTNKSIDAMASA